MRFNKLDMNLLAALDVLLKTRSVTRASEEMFITQSAMSNALGRLRIFFDDPLLVQVGRGMELSPLAETLREPVREIMMRVESATRIRPVFDPLTDARTFNIVLSDYSLATLGGELSRRVADQAPNIRLNLRPQHADPSKLLDRGEADMLIVPDYLGPIDQDHEIIFEDEMVVLVDAHGPHAEGPMTPECFAAAPQVLMEPLSGQKSYSEVAIREAGIEPNTVLWCYLFSAIPELIRGTDRIALIQRRLAQVAVERGGMRMHPAPFEVASLKQSMRWHKHRTRDPGLIWLRALVRDAAGASEPEV
ncbi:transcriptional regulator, LysR family [Pseudooceanicola antarcticus]|uniref:LysR family transcriptional regulator n=1 Tax=Pseudooceanicola antarcticus TaxID=1247613 RepID=A0A285JGA9_9RHOB|nr:LysR family transcriptional regulator [Pseudooceanicola antarcticus]PJE26382.1 LysR family transcriptional regulator [Pseudooceanicola antarcticus]SNY59285.1 transcriptional regulator, LysR family [Pseudooceanicola antarcticus]